MFITKLYAAPRGLNMYKTRKAEKTGNVVLNYRKRPHSSILSNIIYLLVDHVLHMSVNDSCQLVFHNLSDH